MGVVGVVLMDFVVPVMYLGRIPVMAAWSVVIERLLKERPGSIALYLFARIVLHAVLGVLSIIAILLTCCIAAIPYVGSVILLPLMVFQIAYPLAFLEQLGPEWRFFPFDRQASSMG